MPIFTHYALARHKPRKPRRLYDKRGPLMKARTKEYFRYNKVKMLDGGEPRLLERRPAMNRQRAGAVARKHGTPVVVIDHERSAATTRASSATSPRCRPTTR